MRRIAGTQQDRRLPDFLREDGPFVGPGLRRKAQISEEAHAYLDRVPLEGLGQNSEEPGMADREARLVEAIWQAAGQYFRLVLLAGAPGSGKTAMLKAVGQENGYPYLNVNLELSKRMLELTRTQRSRQVERLLKDVIASTPGDVVLLDNLEILFDPALEVEPLRLLQVSSRNRTVVASWNGTFKDGTLNYAEPGHPEFLQVKQAEAVIVPAGSTPS